MFDTILPYSREEILYSWLARMKTYYGYSMADAKKNFFIDSKKNTYEIIKFNNEIIKGFSIKGKESNEMFKEMSIDNFYYYIQDYLIHNPNIYLKDISRNKYFNKLGFFYFSENNHLKFCPLCLESDKKRYGYKFIKKKHMVYGNSFCTIHNCGLKYISYSKENLSIDMYDINTIDIMNAKEYILQYDEYLKNVIKTRSQFIDYYYNSKISSLLECFRNKIYCKLVNDNIIQEDFTLEFRRLRIYQYRDKFISFNDFKSSLLYIIFEGNCKRLSVLSIIDILSILFDSVDDFLDYPNVSIPKFILNPLKKETYYIRDFKRANVYHEIEYTNVEMLSENQCFICSFNINNFKFQKKIRDSINYDYDKFILYTERDLYNKYIDKDLFEVNHLKKNNYIWIKLSNYHKNIRMWSNLYDTI